MTLPTINVQLQGSHQLTIHQIAKAFCDMDADQQADFFEKVADISGDWHRNRVFQWSCLRDSIDRKGNENALAVLRELAEYSE